MSGRSLRVQWVEWVTYEATVEADTPAEAVDRITGILDDEGPEGFTIVTTGVEAFAVQDDVTGAWVDVPDPLEGVG